MVFIAKNNIIIICSYHETLPCHGLSKMFLGAIGKRESILHRKLDGHWKYGCKWIFLNCIDFIKSAIYLSHFIRSCRLIKTHLSIFWLFIFYFQIPLEFFDCFRRVSVLDKCCKRILAYLFRTVKTPVSCFRNWESRMIWFHFSFEMMCFLKH